MTNLPIVEAIRTSDGTLFNPSEYKKAVQHEKMVQAGIEYQNIIAGDYLREWLEENQDENAIDLISDPAIVSFAKALLVAASDHKQAMNEELPFEPVESDDYAALTLEDVAAIDRDAFNDKFKPSDYAVLDIAELEDILSGDVDFNETAEDPDLVHPKEQVDSYYFQAVEMIRSGDINPSINAIRTAFSIGSTRAGSIMNCMVADKVVSEPVKGVRTVLSQIA